MNQFSKKSQNNWKQNSLHSSRPANQYGQPPFLSRKDADQSNKSCEKCKGSQILATCPEYQKCAADQRYDIVSKKNLCSSCLSNKHFKQSHPSTYYAKHEKDFTTQLCMILRNKLSGPPHSLLTELGRRKSQRKNSSLLV